MVSALVDTDPVLAAPVTGGNTYPGDGDALAEDGGVAGAGGDGGVARTILFQCHPFDGGLCEMEGLAVRERPPAHGREARVDLLADP